MYTLPQHGPFSSKHCSANNSHQIQIQWGILYWANMCLIDLRYNFQTLSDCSGVQEHNAYKIMNALVTTVHGFQKEGKRKERKKKKKEKQGAYATLDTINGVMQNHNQEVCLPRTLTPLPLVPALHFTAYATSDTINHSMLCKITTRKLFSCPRHSHPFPAPTPTSQPVSRATTSSSVLHFTVSRNGQLMSYAASRLDWGCGMGGRGVGRRGSAQGKEKRYPVRNMCRGSLSLIYIYTYSVCM